MVSPERRLGLRRRRLLRRRPRRSARWPTLDALIAEAGERGIRVLLDLVPNHTSDRHPWFVDARSSRDAAHRDWYVWADPKPDGSPPEQLGERLRRRRAWTFDEATRPVLPAQLPARRSPTSTGGTRTCATRSTTSCASGSTAASPASASTSCHIDHQGPRAARQPARRPRTTTGTSQMMRPAHGLQRVTGPRCTTCCAAGARSPTSYDPPRVLIGETYVLEPRGARARSTAHGDELNLAFNFPLRARRLRRRARCATSSSATEALLPARRVAGVDGRQPRQSPLPDPLVRRRSAPRPRAAL